MATLLLTAAGQALGGALGLGGLGATLGKAGGALAGAVADKMLFGTDRTIETGKLADLSVQASSEGASLPLVYGRARLAGQVIWATRFEEVVSEEKAGAKAGGGPTVRAHSYFANFGVALSEGPITRIGRIWADGKPLDEADLTIRRYLGTADQSADPLIAAFHDPAPAYRHTAYVVFERLPLSAFGNRLPQLSFEVVRVVDQLEGLVRAVTLIPGAGEFVYAPDPVRQTEVPGAGEVLNRHELTASSDLNAALDELQALCPALESVALVVSWFGDDLRAGTCSIRPKVEVAERQTSGAVWSAGSIEREEAALVSQIDGRPAFGGTPSDDTVIAAIEELKARGLRVVLYPFLLMDVPPGNGLPDPEGASEQPAFPWRGRIEAMGDPVADMAAFFGSAGPGDFSVTGGVLAYSGPEEWTFRRHILSLAHLAAHAGGVDAFLIGSELRGLSGTLEASGGAPFAAQMQALASDVRQVLGPQTKLSYAADWSEYGSRQIGGNLRYPLDPLWADPEIDFIGIDAYFPMADFRDGDDDPYDLGAFRAGIAGGEYFDWYYQSDEDRRAGIRTPITDGAHAKPWVYRAKDLKSWWQNAHHERIAGVEEPAPTAWVPASKPVWFTELGVPAIDKGANQPNVFVDPKSSESAFPHFSTGSRDDFLQRRALEAALSYWDDRHPDWPMGDNPVSPVYGGRMLDSANLHLWTWDARPFPAFPIYGDVWSDGDNWQVGHWLNGRLGGAGLGAILQQLLADHGIPAEAVRIGNLEGSLDGLVVAGPQSARSIIEPLLTAFGGLASDRGTHIELHAPSSLPLAVLGVSDLASEGEAPCTLQRTRAQESELPSEIRLSGDHIAEDYRRRLLVSRRIEGASLRVESLDLPVAAPPDTLLTAADRLLNRAWRERDRIAGALAPHHIALEPGDTIEITAEEGQTYDPPLLMRLTAIEEAGARIFEAVPAGRDAVPVRTAERQRTAAWVMAEAGPPHTLLLDLPALGAAATGPGLSIAAFSRPWPGELGVLRSATGSDFREILSLRSPATIGRLTAPLNAGATDLWDEKNAVHLELFGGELQSRPADAVLAGGNLLAVRSRTGAFEVLQFRTAELTGARHYRLSGLLRAQGGTEPEMLAGADTGADVVLLGPEVIRYELTEADLGRSFHYRVLPPGKALDGETSLALDHAASGRDLKPLSPVQLKANRTPEGVLFSWIRRSRSGAEGWEAADVPLAEETEAYEADVLASDGVVLRTLSSQVPEVLYESADETADFGGPQSEIGIEVFQMSAVVGRGTGRKADLNV